MTQARLQFRWEATDKPADEFGARDWICKYELSVPLDPHDIRREDEDHNKVRDALVVELGSTKRGSCQVPCVNDDGSFYFDAPYRDGAHATWDAPKLGNLPIVCIAIDGTVIPKPIKPEDTPPQEHMVGLESDPATLRGYCQQLLDMFENYGVDIEGEDNDLIAHISKAVDPAHVEPTDTTEAQSDA